MTLLVAGFSLTAMAQKPDEDKKNRPPKDPPQIVVPDKPKDRPRDDNNNNTNRPKKPQEAILSNETRVLTSSI